MAGKWRLDRTSMWDSGGQVSQLALPGRALSWGKGRVVSHIGLPDRKYTPLLGSPPPGMRQNSLKDTWHALLQQAWVLPLISCLANFQLQIKGSLDVLLLDMFRKGTTPDTCLWMRHRTWALGPF